jgi:hypothetical protein
MVLGATLLAGPGRRALPLWMSTLIVAGCVAACAYAAAGLHAFIRFWVLPRYGGWQVYEIHWTAFVAPVSAVVIGLSTMVLSVKGRRPLVARGS